MLETRLFVEKTGYYNGKNHQLAMVCSKDLVVSLRTGKTCRSRASSRPGDFRLVKSDVNYGFMRTSLADLELPLLKYGGLIKAHLSLVIVHLFRIYQAGRLPSDINLDFRNLHSHLLGNAATGLLPLLHFHEPSGNFQCQCCIPFIETTRFLHQRYRIAPYMRVAARSAHYEQSR